MQNSTWMVSNQNSSTSLKYCFLDQLLFMSFSICSDCAERNRRRGCFFPPDRSRLSSCDELAEDSSPDKESVTTSEDELVNHERKSFEKLVFHKSKLSLDTAALPMTVERGIQTELVSCCCCTSYSVRHCSTAVMPHCTNILDDVASCHCQSAPRPRNWKLLPLELMATKRFAWYYHWWAVLVFTILSFNFNQNLYYSPS